MKQTDNAALTLNEFTSFLDEIKDQPAWRAKADREMDYVDGNQLDSQLLKKQQELGIPPAIENVMQPVINAVCGLEAKTRKDWRITPDGDPQGQDVADALNYKLNQAERHSKADKACSEAFRPQLCVGVGFVEVSRESDPFKYPYRAGAVHRNEIFWDMLAKETDMSDARYLVRKRWMDAKRVALVFPQHKDLIEHCNGRWSDRYDITTDGSASTDLADGWATERGWSIEEQEWYNAEAGRVCLFECWYRRWESVPVLKSPDGRVVEFDEANPAHLYAVATGTVKLQKAIVARVRRSYWLGPHCLHDGPSPYPHRHFPYVPFWGQREDRTGVPYGVARAMMYPQDSINSGISKLRWGMSSVRTERTKGAVAMTDAQFRQQVARVDADIVLDANHMAQQGARFEVKRDYTLSEQHYKMLQDARASIERSSGVTAGFMGQTGTATSGLQEQTQVEQSTQAIADLMDNFSTARTMVGELLMALIIEDLGTSPETVVIEGDAVRPERTVLLNQPEADPATGIAYLSNDVQRTRLKVALEDVPTSSSFRAQQLNAMSEVVKAMPPAMQQAVMPFMVGLMDVPYKRDVVEAIRAAAQQETPEAIEKRIQQAVQDALAKAGNDLKARELAIKERKADSEVREIDARSVQIGVQAAYSAMQAGAQVAQMPQIAPVADAVMQGAGYRRPNPAGQDPNFPTPAGLPMPAGPAPGVQANTSPAFPPVPDDGTSPMAGIETPTTADNLQGADA